MFFGGAKKKGAMLLLFSTQASFFSPVSGRHLRAYFRERALASHLTFGRTQQTPHQGAQLEEEWEDARQAPS